MYGRIKDGASPDRPTGSCSVQHLTIYLGACVVLWSCMGRGPAVALAQGPDLEANVREIQLTREWIHVPVNKSILIETNLPATRQQTLSPDIAEIQSISPTQLLVTGRSFGRTQVIIWSGEQRRVFDVSVELELDLLREAIRRVDPQGHIDAYPVMDTVVLTGTVSDADASDRILQVASIFATNVQNHLQVAGEQQVLLHVMIAEISKAATRQLGINGYLIGSDFKDMPIVSNIGGVNPTSFGATPGPVTTDLPFFFQGATVGDNPTLSIGFPRVQMQLFIQAMRENRLLKILAEPNLVTISGRTASFLAGGEFPIPVPQAGAGGGNVITIEYREFGARLSFTPVVLANQRIRMNIAPEVSDLDFTRGVSFAGFTVPGLNVRRTETTVEIGNGQVLAIAGLLSETVRAFSTRIPGLGDIPVLGALFASTQYQKELTDLAVVVTPHIVAPMEPDQLGPLPGDGLLEPDDWQLFALGMLEGEETPPPDQTETPAQPQPEEMPDDMVAPIGQAGIIGPWGLADSEESGQ